MQVERNSNFQKIRDEEKTTLRVAKIENGSVIDHIPPGRAIAVLKILGITGKEGITVSVLINAPSKRMGRKDIVKIENRELTTEEINKISLIAPHATLNIIRNYDVVKKENVSIPEVIEGIIKCKNQNCITNKKEEPITPKFIKLNDFPVKLKCCYCEEKLEEKDIIEQFEQK